MILNSVPAIMLLCLIHIFVNRLKFTGMPRSKWLSIAGGISVSYIFLQAFPELHHFQEEINREDVFSIGRIHELEIYLVGLLGLSFFYGLENKTRKSVESRRKPNEGEHTENIGIFWIHITSFAVYNFIIGYLLLNREEVSFLQMLLYAVAMSFHLIVTDHSLESHFAHNYRKRGRWLLVTALIAGWATSIFTSIQHTHVGIIFAFIAGGVIMNVMKEELPRERESDLLSFLAGVLFYSVVLILV